MEPHGKIKNWDCKFDACIFSFHPVKPITTAEGGAVLHDKKIHNVVEMLRTHGITKKGIFLNKNNAAYCFNTIWVQL